MTTPTTLKKYQKPILRILTWDYTINEFKVLGELDKYISYEYTLKHNDISDGILEFDPVEPQAKAFVNLLDSTSWDSKEEDIFIWNIHNELEFFKIQKAEFSNEAQQKRVMLSGTNAFFLTDRVYLVDDFDKQKEKETFINKTKDFIIEELIDKTCINPRGTSATHIQNRTYPYLELENADAPLPPISMEVGINQLSSLSERIFSGNLEGYRIKIIPDENKIVFKPVLQRENIEVMLSESFNNENGYNVTIEGSRKLDFAITKKGNAIITKSSQQIKSGGRFKEEYINTQKTTTNTSIIASEIEQILLSKSDYKPTTTEINDLTDSSLLSKLELGDIITIQIDDVVRIDKQAQVKAIQSISADDEFRVIPILDDSAKTVEQILAEKIRTLKEELTDISNKN